MNIENDQLDSLEIGNRLRLTRERLGITQAAAADAVKLSRTTLIAVEQGQRRIRMSEIRMLAQFYNTPTNALLRKESVHVSFLPKFRKLPLGNNDASDEAVKILTNLVQGELELESLLGVSRPKEYPPERPILPGDVVAQAEQNAMEVRERLGLGNAPIVNITSILEFDLNVRIYIRKLDSSISGLFAYDDSVGACILLNALHPRARRAQTAAHEFGHFMSTRRDPEILNEGEMPNSREEKYAIAFGRAFVTPVRAVMQKFQDVTSGSDHTTRRHVIILANYFGVSREAIVRRMEELKLVKSGTWDWFAANGGITDDQERQVLGDQYVSDSQKIEAARPTTLKMQSLAVEAYRRELLSESQLSQLLCIDRVELREILDGADDEIERGGPEGVLSRIE